MLGPGDRLVLAAGVRLTGVTLADDVRGSAWPLNATAAFVLEREGHALGEIAEDVAAAFALPADRARSDVLAFAWQLNRLTLANIERPRGRLRHLLAWVALALRLLPAAALPPAAARRRHLDTTTPARAVRSVVRAAWARSVTIGALTAIGVLSIGLPAGTAAFLPALAAGAGMAAGVTLHEAAHAAALQGVPSALVVQGRRTYVLHAATGSVRRALVALAGPLAVCALGLLLMVAASIIASPALALAGGPLCAHATGLTLLGPDGRSACGL
jgi:Coenzyme PQQ synthesis protein D (PqqD)